jgi:hypothetical protein
MKSGCKEAQITKYYAESEGYTVRGYQIYDNSMEDSDGVGLYQQDSLLKAEGLILVLYL